MKSSQMQAKINEEAENFLGKLPQFMTSHEQKVHS